MGKTGPSKTFTSVPSATQTDQEHDMHVEEMMGDLIPSRQLDG